MKNNVYETFSEAKEAAKKEQEGVKGLKFFARPNPNKKEKGYVVDAARDSSTFDKPTLLGCPHSR